MCCTQFAKIVRFFTFVLAYIKKLLYLCSKILDMTNADETKLSEFNDFVQQLSDEQLELVLRYFDFLRALIENNQQKTAANMVHSLMCYLVECKPSYAYKPRALPRPEQICGQFLALVEMCCREQHRVEWYASRMCLTPKYLSNVLKQTLDMSPNSLIDQALLRQAKSLLSSTSLSIQQISDLLGFQNQSHFGTFFKRHETLSPAAYRKKGMY